MHAALYHNYRLLQKVFLKVKNIVHYKLFFMKTYLIFLSTLIINSSIGQTWTKNFDYVDESTTGLAKVQKNKKIGFVDPKGKLVVPLVYDDAFPFAEGLAAVKSGYKWGFVDMEGNMVIPPKYDDAYSFNEGFAKVEKQSHAGFIDKTGKEVISLVYSHAGRFSDGLAPVCNDKELWGYVDKNGKEVIRFNYAYANSFSEGIAHVIKNGKEIIIDKSGKETAE